MHLPEQPAAAEQWSADSVTLRMVRRPIRLIVLWTVVAGLVAFGLQHAAFSLVVGGGFSMIDFMSLVALAAVTLPTAFIAIVGSAAYLGEQSLTVEVGPKGLIIGKRRFALEEVADVTWDTGRLVVELDGGAVYRSPELTGDHPDRLMSLIRDNLMTERARERAEAHREAMSRALAPVRERASEGGQR